MDPTTFIKHLKQQNFYQNQLTHLERLGGRRAQYSSLERPLLRPLVEAVKAGGVGRLYSHQGEAIDAARSGQDVIIATSTASGKTLCYNLPVLEATLLDWQARALYLFPTKALAQDQLRTLKELTARLKHTLSANQNGRSRFTPPRQNH